MRRALLLAIVLAGCGCPCDATDIARDLAGDGATDCGFVRLGDDPAPVLACAEQAIAEERAFSAGFARFGIDSEVRTYVTRREDGSARALSYDGDPSGGDGACPRLVAFRCVGPIERRTDGFGPRSVTILACSTSSTEEAVLCDR
ncbi:hypothetical protein [Sandaracinus amylolyticus]|nr:hypothetical protein [Sandaracinus amylolyticus]